MKSRNLTPTKISYAMVEFRATNHQETRYYCDLCKGEVGEAEGKDLPDGRFVHKRHKIPVTIEVESPSPDFWTIFKTNVNKLFN